MHGDSDLQGPIQRLMRLKDTESAVRQAKYKDQRLNKQREADDRRRAYEDKLQNGG